MKKGMTLIEILVAVGIIAILVAIAVPALSRILPYAELRSDARYLATTMRQARLRAANLHKPVRVVVDCSGRPAVPCTMRTYVAVFNDGSANAANLGQFVGWAVSSADNPTTAAPEGGAVHEFARSVTILDNTNYNQGLPGRVAVTTGPNIFWAVFLPSSRMIGSHAPFNITLSSNAASASRVLRVDGVTGRATVVND